VGKAFSRLVEVAHVVMGQAIGIAMVATCYTVASAFMDATGGWGLAERWREGENGNGTFYSINYICFGFLVMDSMSQNLT
jgi:hypothetical protein